MDLRVEQGCPQCGATIELAETERLLACSFCGVKNYLQSNGPFRYVLPLGQAMREEAYLLAPYARFKGTVYWVTDRGIEHRVVDTTQLAITVPGLPPSLGVRPQAMRLSRVAQDAPCRYLPQTIKTSSILEKAAAISSCIAQPGSGLYHRAYIGESLSCIYLPLVARRQALFDGVTNLRLAEREESGEWPLLSKVFDESWQVRFLAALCPQCGDRLDGAGDCQAMTCATCQTLWEFGGNGLNQVAWGVVPSSANASLYLPFWKIGGQIPAMGISSFADFVERTNQPFLARNDWQKMGMSFWIPAIKLRPKIFLQAGRQATLAQWRFNPPVNSEIKDNLFPVTLPGREARQAVKVVLAAATASSRLVYPFLPQAQLTNVEMRLMYLPFVEQGSDWVQPDAGIVIAKNILRFGRMF